MNIKTLTPFRNKNTLKRLIDLLSLIRKMYVRFKNIRKRFLHCQREICIYVKSTSWFIVTRFSIIILWLRKLKNNAQLQTASTFAYALHQEYQPEKTIATVNHFSRAMSSNIIYIKKISFNIVKIIVVGKHNSM